MSIATRLLLVVLVTCLAACSTSPTGRRQLTLYPEREIAAMGDASFAQLKEQEKILQENEVTAYVRCVARPMIRDVGGEWEIQVFHSDEVNAFALPGNNIGIHSGLLTVAENQHQLAAVIAHEIAHVLARHANARMSAQFASRAGLDLVGAVSGGSETVLGKQVMAALGLGTQVGILLPFSRSQESEADVLGLELMAENGFDPRQAVQLWRNMAAQSDGAPPEFMSTHPASQTRIRQLEARMPDAVARYEQAGAAGDRPACSI